MIPILLLATNFVRQNRWLLLAFALWPFLMGVLVSQGERNAGDVAELITQELFYGAAVVAFLSSSAIYNERRSRRIVGVLSKGVSRVQFVIALLVGTVFCSAVYFAAVAGSMILLLGSSQTIMTSALTMWIKGVTISTWISAAGLLFSTFVYPFIAAALTGIAAFAPLAVSRKSVYTPAASLMQSLNSSPSPHDWNTLVIALIESSLFIALAASIFARRDVTVSIE